MSNRPPQRLKFCFRAYTPRQLVFFFAVIIFTHVLLPRCAAQPATQHEYELKAAVLYHVIKYVEWTAGASTNAALQVGLVGEMPFADAIEVLNGKKIQGRELTVKRVAALQDIGQCQVLFISASERQRLREIVGEVKGRPILTVSEVEGFA